MIFKNYILLLLISLNLIPLSNAHNGHENHDSKFTSPHNPTTTNQNIVYICMGGYAYAYHSISNCPGLGNCRSEIKYTYESVAINNYKRVPCCRCWSNVYGRCNDDNPRSQYGGGSGGGGGGIEAAIAIGLLTVGVAMLSNDIYFYPTYSFKQVQLNNTIANEQYGYTLGFRRDFNKVILEYGLSFLKTVKTTDFGFGMIDSYETDRIGGHFNTLIRIKHNRSQNGFFIGPTLNYVYDYGIGGIFGYEFKIFDRVNLDLRYELTTQTNQLQAGLVIKYQKDFFWKK